MKQPKPIILGAHNAWSYLKPKTWWMKLIAFTAKCQEYTIPQQYELLSVKDFDLRLRMSSCGAPCIVHGIVEYEYFSQQLERDLEYLNDKKDCSVRIMLDVRTKKQYTSEQSQYFRLYCKYLYLSYPNIRFWGGKNLYNYEVEFDFSYKPICIGKYSSVCSPKILDDWWPWLYAKLHNHENLQDVYDCDILQIDFVNIQ